MLLSILRVLPRRVLSRLFGAFMALRLPQPFGAYSVRAFARVVGADLSEAAHPIEAYRTVSDFFCRELKPGIRPIEGGIVSPVDGTFRDVSRGRAGQAVQVKGIEYSIAELLGKPEWASFYSEAEVISLYLSPKDYHRIHSPCDGAILSITHIPGDLWPVNDDSLRTIPNLFPTNERVVLRIDTPHGGLAVVFVGATNVGSMSLPFHHLATNRREISAITTIPLVPPRSIKKGDHIGTFHLGSTVLVVVPPETRAKFGPCVLGEGSSVRYGTTLLGTLPA